MSNIGVRRSRSTEQRVVEIIEEQEKDFIQSLKPVDVESSAPLGGGGSQGSSASNQGTGSFLPLAGGVMAGPIGLKPILLEIEANGDLNLDETHGFSPRVIINGNAGDMNDIIERIEGGNNNFPGRQISIQGTTGETYTFKHLFNGGSNGDIRTPNGLDFVLTGENNVTLIYDAINNEWVFMDGALAGGDASQWSTFPALQDINFATFDGINIDRLRFVSSSGAVFSGSDVSILKDAGGNLQLNVALGDDIIGTVDDVPAVTIDDTFAIFQNPNGIYVLELQNANTGIIDLDQVGEVRFKGFKQAGGLETYGRILVNADDVDPASSLDARMSIFLMRDGNSELFISFNTLGSNEIEIQKLVNFNNNELFDTAGIFPQDNGLDDIGGSGNSYNSIFLDAVHFIHSQVQVAGRRMISFEGGGDMEYNVPTGNLHVLRFQGVDEYLISASLFQFKNLNQLQFLDSADNQDIKINYQDPVFLINLSGSSTQFKINNDAVIPDFVLEGENTGAGLLAHAFLFEGKSATGVTREYGSIKVRQTVVTNGSEDGAMEFALIEAGVPDVPYVDLNAQFQQVRILKALNLNNNKITGVDFMNFNERVGDPTVGANEGVLYVKDVSGNSRLFFDNNTEGPVELGAGGGGSAFADDVFEIFDDITSSKKLTFSLATATGTNLFAIFGTSDTYTFPNGGGTVIMSQGNQTIGGLKTFSASTFFDSNVDLGDNVAETVTFVARVDSDLDPNTNGTRDLGNFTGQRWDVVACNTVGFDSAHQIFMDASIVRIETNGTGDTIVFDDGLGARITYDWLTDDFYPVDSVANLGRADKRWIEIFSDNVLNVSFTKFKQNIVTLSDVDCMAVCEALPTIEYEWKPERFDKAKSFTKLEQIGRRLVGFNADALKTILPLAVKDDMVYTNAVIGSLLGAVRHLDTRLKVLEP